jgi:hypothetical protein
MVYKKYVKKHQKLFGPYYYESSREGEKVKSRFLSGPTKLDLFILRIKNRKKAFLRLITILAFFCLCSVIYLGTFWLLLK